MAMQVLGALQLMVELANVGMISIAGARREHFRDGRCRAFGLVSFSELKNLQNKLQCRLEPQNITLVQEASVGVEWRASGSLASRP